MKQRGTGRRNLRVSARSRGLMGSGLLHRRCRGGVGDRLTESERRPNCSHLRGVSVITCIGARHAVPAPAPLAPFPPSTVIPALYRHPRLFSSSPRRRGSRPATKPMDSRLRGKDGYRDQWMIVPTLRVRFQCCDAFRSRFRLHGEQGKCMAISPCTP